MNDRLEELFDRFGDRLYHYLVFKLGSAGDAEDVLQEVFVRLTRAGIRLKLVRRLDAFAFKIAKNEALRFLERRGARDVLRLEESVLPGLAEAVEGPDPAEVRRLSEALGRLPAEQREVIVLRYFEDLNFKDIAGICGISENTATSRCRYGLGKLRAVLEGRHDPT
jgi:RNA polymerase sigma-70 factor (ECF subfamily)